MQAECQQNSGSKSTTSGKAADIVGFDLGNSSFKLHAIEALNCWTSVIRTFHSKHFDQGFADGASCGQQNC